MSCSKGITSKPYACKIEIRYLTDTLSSSTCKHYVSNVPNLGV